MLTFSMKTFAYLWMGLLLFASLPGGRILASEDRQLVDRVAAVVNSEVITQSEFDTVFRPIYEQIKQAYQGSNLQGELEKVRLQLLNQVIEDRLVYQEAQKMGIVVTDDEIEQELSAFKSQFPDEATFEKELGRSGITISDLEKRIRERVAITRLHQHVIRGRTNVLPSEIEKYYADHPGEFAQKEQVKIWGMTLRKSDEAIQKGTTDETIRRRAGKFVAELKQGADFEEYAKKYSQDAQAQQGGLIGFVGKGDLVHNIDEAIFSLPENSISDVLETENAYHIFKIGEKKSAAAQTFEEAKDEIENKLFREKAHERFVAWMDELKKKSFISIR